MTGERENPILDFEQIFEAYPDLFSLEPRLKSKDGSAGLPDLITGPYTDAGCKGEGMSDVSGLGGDSDLSNIFTAEEDTDGARLREETLEQIKKSKLSEPQKRIIAILCGSVVGVGLDLGLHLAGVDYMTKKTIGIVAGSAWFVTGVWASTEALQLAARAKGKSKKERFLLGVSSVFHKMTTSWRGFFIGVVAGYNAALLGESLLGKAGLAEGRLRQNSLEREQGDVENLFDDSERMTTPTATPSLTLTHTPFHAHASTPAHHTLTPTPEPTATQVSTHTPQMPELFSAPGADESGGMGELPKVDAGQAELGQATQVTGSAGVNHLVPDAGIEDLSLQPEPPKTVVNPPDFKPRFGHVTPFSGKPEAGDLAQASKMHGKPEWFAAHRAAVPVELPRDAGEYVVQPGQTMTDLAEGLARNQGGSMFENLLKLFQANRDYLLSNSNPNRDLAQVVFNNLPESGSVDFQRQVGDASLAQVLMKSMNFIRSGQVINLP